jgi:hypothetical protein
MSLLPESLASWIVIAVLLFWFVGAYNRLVRLRAAVLQAYGALDAALSKQLDFVQASITAAPAATDAANAPSESLSSIAPLQAATTQLATLLGATRLASARWRRSWPHWPPHCRCGPARGGASIRTR